jgi:hypothetical protein
VEVQVAAAVYGGAWEEIIGVIVSEPVFFDHAASLVNGVLSGDVHGGDYETGDVVGQRHVDR